MIEPPQIRPGQLGREPSGTRVVAFFPHSAGANAAIQLLLMSGVTAEDLAVTPPDRVEGGQGMVLSVGCPDPALLAKVEAVCRRYRAHVHRQHPESPDETPRDAATTIPPVLPPGGVDAGADRVRPLGTP